MQIFRKRLSSDEDKKEYTEQEIYNMAVKAYKNKKLKPLLNIKPESLSDRYYWCYLATDPVLFYNTMEIEMFRRRDLNKLTLVDVDDYLFKIWSSPYKGQLSYDSYNGHEEPFTKDYELDYKSGRYFNEETIKDNTRARSNLLDSMGHRLDQIKDILPIKTLGLSDPNYTLSGTLTHYPDIFIKMVEDICKLGGIPAGGFVSGLINPYYNLLSIEDSYINFNWKEEKYSNPIQVPDRDYTFMHWGMKEVTREPENGGPMMKPIKGFGKAVLVYRSRSITQEEAEENLRSVKYKNILKCRERFKDFNLERSLNKLRRHLYTKDGKIYQKIFKKSPDVDIFITGDDYLEKANKIIKMIRGMNFGGGEEIIHISEFAITIQCEAYWPKIQIIKRAYNSIDEILAGFDLDSSRAALLWENGNFKPVCTKSFIDSVELGINLIVPSRQSETFNHRLIKYSSRGYNPYFVGKIIKKITKQSGDILRTGAHLLHYPIFNNFSRGSDYIKEEFEERQIAIGEIIGELSDDKDPVKSIGKYIPILFPVINKEAVYWFAKLLLKMTASGHVESFSKGKIDWFIVKVFIQINWRTTNPGSQITASFNPTYHDYLAGKINLSPSEEEVKYNPLEDKIKNILGKDIASLIMPMLEPDYEYIYSYLWKSVEMLSRGKIGENTGDEMWRDYSEGKEA